MILVYPIHAIAYFIVMGTDITVFFLVIRLVRTWRDVEWLAAFDRVGRGLVDKVTTSMHRLLPQQGTRRLSEQRVLILGIVFLTVLHHALTVLMRLGA